MRALVILLLILVAFIATTFKGFNNVISDKLNYSNPTPSALAARLTGVFEASISTNPQKVNFDGQQIEICDAWIEKRYKRKYFLIWFPYNHIKDGFNLCFTIKGNTQIFKNPIYWYQRGAGNSFGSINRYELFYATFPNIPDCISASIVSRDKSKSSEYVTFTIKK